MGFIGRSLLLLFALYGLVFAVGDALLVQGAAPMWWGVSLIVALIGMQYHTSPWLIEHCFRIHWDEDALPVRQKQFVEQLCRRNGIPTPRLGVIESGTPNAFAFGRIQSDARVVVTRGLLDVLTEDETNAVLAHEIGHIQHYDFAVMALAAVAPLLLYHIYVIARRVNHLRLVSYFAYLAYWVGRFLVLLLNRTREYGADHYSAQETRTPNALCTALVKIAYGRMLVDQEAENSAKAGDKKAREAARRQKDLGRTVALMGIMSVGGANALHLTASPEQASRAMRWDLVNPWARFYEFCSTHPLTALRLRALSREAERQGQSVTYRLPSDARTKLLNFPIEFVFWVAPYACAFLLASWMWIGKNLEAHGVIAPPHMAPWLLIGLGVTWAARIAFRYRGRFERARIEELIDDLNVSQMQPRAVEIEGEIIGNGLPGAFWSPDLVLRDETGMMFLYYRSSIPLGRLFFALRSANRLVGERVKVQGWYRRGLRPYVEMSQVESRVSKAAPEDAPLVIFGKEGSVAPLEYEDLSERSYSQWIQLGVSAACTAAGILLLTWKF
ncbi:MAG TPA: M48 family metalloprotease [Terracidiphilus sp.]|jgi:heat shock protein HtpX|nr:M48 family metalloprotease [Terracidiphilus sp.]